jgi:hypothetical protein
MEGSQPKLAIEVSIDFLPKEFQGNWHRTVHAYTAKWVEKNAYREKATLWFGVA